MDSGECIKSKHLVSAGYGTFSSMPSSAKEPREDTYTSSSSPKGRSSSVSATLGPLYGFNPHLLGSDVPYQGLPFGSYFLSGDAMPSGPPPMFSSSAGATPGALYGFNPPPFGSDAPYQGLPLGSHFPSGDAMPSGPPPMFSSSAGATPGALYGFNPPPFGSDAPYQGLPLGSHFPSGDAMPSGPPPMFSSSAGERLYLFTFTINKLQIQTTCKIAELIKAGSMETCLSHHTILF